MSDWQPCADVTALVARAQILEKIRRYFAQQSVHEVHTPLLGEYTVTEPNVEAIAVPGYGYLQTSPEYFMKRLLAAGMPDCYQLGPAFRHAELGRLHNPEFVMLEWYRLGFDHLALMQEVSVLVDLVLGAASYHTVGYQELLRDVDIETQPADALDLAFATACEALSGRWFVTQYPHDQAVLARNQAAHAARFELVIDGIEVANGYWELQDPDEHRRRFTKDIDNRRARKLAEPQFDPRFLAAIESGLPDCAGVAVGIDRLVMLSPDVFGEYTSTPDEQRELPSLDQVVTFRH